MKSITRRLLGLFFSDFLSPSLFTIYGSLLALTSLIVVGTMSYLWPKIRSARKTGPRTEPSLSYITPLYVHRTTQARNQLAAQRRVSQVNFNTRLLWNNESASSTQSGCELLKRRREKNREKRKERLAKRPRINPEELRKVNQKWYKIYGFKNGDLFHIVNELDNIVAKVPSVHSRKGKTIKFDDAVHVVFIEKANNGRRVNRCKVPRSAVNCTEVRSEQQIIV